MIALLRQVADAGAGEGALWAAMRMHLMSSTTIDELGASSKFNAEWDFLTMLKVEGRRCAESFWRRMVRISVKSPPSISTFSWNRSDAMGLLGILLALGLLVWLAYRGWSVLLLAPAAALIAAAISREPLLANWTQTFMGSAAQFLAQFFPLFLLGALFGKLMDDSGSVEAIARFMTERLGPGRAILAEALALAHR